MATESSQLAGRSPVWCPNCQLLIR
ncbi:zinc finger domain-containing protein [Phaeodactylibacter sp.]